MSGLVVGTTALGAVTLTADPNSLQIAWQPRIQVFSGPGGWSQAQAFGMPVGDMQIPLSSGQTGPLETETVQAILALERAQTPIAYTDALGNVLTVLILNFVPAHRGAGLWDYALLLQVRAATAILGVAEA